MKRNGREFAVLYSHYRQLDTVHLGGLNILFRYLAVICIYYNLRSNIQQFSGIDLRQLVMELLSSCSVILYFVLYSLSKLKKYRYDIR